MCLQLFRIATDEKFNAWQRSEAHTNKIRNSSSWKKWLSWLQYLFTEQSRVEYIHWFLFPSSKVLTDCGPKLEQQRLRNQKHDALKNHQLNEGDLLFLISDVCWPNPYIYYLHTEFPPETLWVSDHIDKDGSTYPLGMNGPEKRELNKK